jgi:hypothetical protein
MSHPPLLTGRSIIVRLALVIMIAGGFAWIASLMVK